MGLFSGHHRLLRTPQFRSPIRLHSTFTLTGLRTRLAQAVRDVPRLAVAATNDARVVGGFLVVAALLLAFEMARSI